MPDVTVCMGVSGVGKSTWLQHHAAGAVVVSADVIRRKQVPPGVIVAQLRRKAERSIVGGFDVATDQCNLDAGHRRWWLRFAVRHSAAATLVVFHPPAMSVIEARQRLRGVEATPAPVVARQMRQWPAALAAARSEGWHRVVEVGEPQERRSRRW